MRIAAAEARAATANAHCMIAETRATAAESNLKHLQLKMESMEREAQNAHSEALAAATHASMCEKEAEVAKSMAKSADASAAAVSRKVSVAQSQAALQVQAAQKLVLEEAKKNSERIGEAEKLAAENAMTASMAIADLRRKTGTSHSPSRRRADMPGTPNSCSIQWSSVGTGTTASFLEMGQETPIWQPAAKDVSPTRGPTPRGGSPYRKVTAAGRGFSPLRPGVKASPCLSPASMRSSPTKSSFGITDEAETFEMLCSARSRLNEQVAKLCR